MDMSQSTKCSQTDANQVTDDLAFIQPYLTSALAMLNRARSKFPRERSESRCKLSSKSSRKRMAKESENGSSSTQSSHSIVSLTPPVKRQRKEVPCVSLSTTESDLENYGSSDESDDELQLPIIDNFASCVIPDSVLLSNGGNSSDLSSISTVDVSSTSCVSSSNDCTVIRNSSTSSSCSVFLSDEDTNESSPIKVTKIKIKSETKVKKEKQRRRSRNFTNYQENNRNGKKLVNYKEDSDSDDEDTDDRTEGHVVCLACGKFNTKRKLYNWISCSRCKNWYHQECTPFWKSKITEVERSEFLCKHCI